jgi:hypothetical protein
VRLAVAPLGDRGGLGVRGRARRGVARRRVARRRVGRRLSRGGLAPRRRRAPPVLDVRALGGQFDARVLAPARLVRDDVRAQHLRVVQHAGDVGAVGEVAAREAPHERRRQDAADRGRPPVRPGDVEDAEAREARERRERAADRRPRDIQVDEPTASPERRERAREALAVGEREEGERSAAAESADAALEARAPPRGEVLERRAVRQRLERAAELDAPVEAEAPERRPRRADALEELVEGAAEADGAVEA